MRKILLALALSFGFVAPASAMTIDVSSDIIRVTTGFNGATLTVFGTQDKPGSVVIVVEGPPKSVTIRKKNRVLGLWTNTDSRVFSNVPSFYEAAATVPLDMIAPPDTLQARRIGLANLHVVPTKGGKMDANTAEFANALFDMQARKKLFVKDLEPLTYPGPNLFKAQFEMPAIVTPGQYRVSAYLFVNGVLTDQDTSGFTVVPEGLSADLRSFATQNGLLYGLTGMLMALIAGWLATVLLKRE